MAQHHKLALPMAASLLLLLATTVGAHVNNDKHLLTGHSFPMHTSLAHQFFVLAAEHAEMANATGTQMVHRSLARNDNDVLCDRDIARIRDAIDNMEEWALEFPDTWGRLPVGFFWGHLISMGQYEECVAATATYGNGLHGQYCLARLNITQLYSKVKQRHEEFSRISYKQTEPEIFELGVCVPSTCSAQKTDELLKHVIAHLYGADIIDLKFEMVQEKWCKYDAPVEFRGVDIFAIIFFSLIIIFLIASSVYDGVQTRKGAPKKPLFVAFSVLQNAPKIFTVKKVNNPNVIHCLNGLRCFSMMWVVFGHGYMTFYDLPHINRNKYYTWLQTPYSMLVQNGSLCVDTFFFMSGLLMCWGAFREMDRTKGKLNIPMMYFHRYIRLTPVVAVVVLYIMSLYRYSGAGPMWFKLGTQDKRCEDTWWATLLYVQNYAFPYSICVSQSWYLAVDTQLYFLSPLFLIPLYKWGKKALLPISIFGVLCLICTVATFLHNDFTLFRVQDDHVDLRQRLTYYPTHTRIPTWLIGVIFGYFLFTRNRGRQIPLAKHWVITGWVVAFGTMLADLWGPFWRMLPDTPDSPRWEGAMFEPLSRSSWALSIGWIVWACYNGHGGYINDFLSWGFFTGFSRLCYCMYVIHRIVQLVNAARLQTDTHFSNYDAILRWWHDFGITLTLSIFATLAFEAPILGIEKAIFGRGDSKPAPKKPVPGDNAKIAPTAAPVTEAEPITTVPEPEPVPEPEIVPAASRAEDPSKA
ncbi:nose resistant to fluoxetine protein 6 [Drosophila grimshawi]|uniref:GH12925 n=1 Tax=Drosophila grimshawi TaxID=7222 RepID=B4JJ08_DROGR|nr:nose resistant to fluoxetine protein 6 [Drosophila grimshawi]EDW00549.1 GH12925 [Drosophila grimshawi]